LSEFIPDPGQGGLPKLDPSELYVWLIEIEAFPPLYEIRFSDKRIANEVYADFGKNKNIKKLRQKYLEMAEGHQDLGLAFFDIPVNLISICKVSEGQRLRSEKKLQEIVELSVNLIPDTSLRWPFTYNVKEDKFSSITECVGRYNGEKKYYVAKLSFLRKVHELNFQTVLPS
jgi:hypothetical protein